MMNIRASVFWIKDLLQGGQIRKELETVRRLNQRTEIAASLREELLQKQLDFVTSEVEFYRSYQGFRALEDFPVLNKNQIIDQQSIMIADGVDPKKCHEASTSGSTGTPFRVLHNAEKRLRVNAEAIYFGDEAGYQIGDILWHLKIWTARNRHSRISTFTKNIHVMDVSSFTEADVPGFLAQIEKKQRISSIISYSSSLETIARAFLNQHENNITRPRVSSVIGQSEPLSQDAREILKEIFGVYPVARYGMEELGIIGQQSTTKSGIYRLNLASHIIEVLQLDIDAPAPPGVVGRIVITDLVNKAQPLVRYDTGDLGVVGKYLEGTNFAASLESLEGRSRDRIFDINDKPLAPMIAYNFWWRFEEIRQYQIVQIARGEYQLKIDAPKTFTRELELVEAFKEQVGMDASVQVKYSSDDYKHKSGKRKVIVSYYSPK